jgi:hypothetical protein
VLLGLSCSALALGITGCEMGGDDGILCYDRPEAGTGTVCSPQSTDSGADSGDATLRDVSGDAVQDAASDAADDSAGADASDSSPDAPADG